MEGAVEAGLSSGKEVRQLLRVTPEHLPWAWGEAAELFNEPKEYWEKYMTHEELYALIAAGQVQLWIMNDEGGFLLGMLTELRRYTTGLLQLRYLWLGGRDIRAGIKFLDYLELWGARQGAYEAAFTGRKSWKRLMRTFGYFEGLNGEYVKDLTEIKEH